MEKYLDKPEEKCGVFGVYSPDGAAALTTYLGLFALQHRGQESAGIATINEKGLKLYKNNGLVFEALDAAKISGEIGEFAIGHVRYAGVGEGDVLNAEPIAVRYRKGSFALAHNGSLVNSAPLRQELEEEGSVFQTFTDSEVIANLLARKDKRGVVEALRDCMQILRGSYALVLLTEGKLIAARDPHGLRPLVLGELPQGGYALASETCAFDTIGAKILRDVKPGEIIVVDAAGLHSTQGIPAEHGAICSFEYIYFARPDSTIDGVNVHLARAKAGECLALEHPVNADVVIAVPDSGRSAAIGFANKSGIPFGEGIMKNQYVGRTFIRAGKEAREQGVKLKLNPIRSVVAGKRVVVVDDSIVRGTTSRRIVKLLRKAGALEVHLRISSPPVISPCYYGIDTPTYEHLLGARVGVEMIEEQIGADSLGYLSLEGLVASIGLEKSELCLACFTGEYPVEVPTHQAWLAKGGE